MLELAAKTFVYALEAYAALGLLFAVAFVAAGMQRLDPGAAGTSVGFRLLMLPGAVALWPMLLCRWLRGQREPPLERTPHRVVKQP